jgi:hypothetical protein
MKTHSHTGVDWLTLNPKTDSYRFQRLTNSLLCIAFSLQHWAVPMETLACPLLVTMQPTCTQQYRSGEHIHATIRPRLLGNHATRQYRVVSVSMEVLNFRLPSNDGIRPNTSQYIYIYIHACIALLAPEWVDGFIYIEFLRVCLLYAGAWQIGMFWVRFEVFTAVTMKNAVFWDVTPCGSCKSIRVTRIGELGTLAVTGNWCMLLMFLAHEFLSPWWGRFVSPKRRFLQEPYKHPRMAFFRYVLTSQTSEDPST